MKSYRLIGGGVLVLAVAGLVTATAWAANRVRGALVDGAGRPIAGATITVLDQDARGVQTMATTVTSSTGKFAVSLPVRTWDPEPGTAARPDIVVVAKRRGSSTILARSRTYTNFDTRRDLSVMLRATAALKPTPLTRTPPAVTTTSSVTAIPADALWNAVDAAFNGPHSGAGWVANYNTLKARADEAVARIKAAPYTGSDAGLSYLYQQLDALRVVLEQRVPQLVTYDVNAFAQVSTAASQLKVHREAYLFYANRQCSNADPWTQCDCLTRSGRAPAQNFRQCHPYCVRWPQGEASCPDMWVP